MSVAVEYEQNGCYLMGLNNCMKQSASIVVGFTLFPLPTGRYHYQKVRTTMGAGGMHVYYNFIIILKKRENKIQRAATTYLFRTSICIHFFSNTTTSLVVDRVVLDGASARYSTQLTGHCKL